jgi:DNA-binding HxlR family transcriptional regulator
MKKLLNTVCDVNCPIARASEVLDGKWTMLVFRDLLSGTKRYSQLQRSILGISPRMLAARLASLGQAGLISKKTYPTVPPKTEYTLTEKGQRIKPVIQAMAKFGSSIPQP